MNSLNSCDVLNAGYFSLTPTVDFFLINLTLFFFGKNLQICEKVYRLVHTHRLSTPIRFHTNDRRISCTEG